MSRVLAVDYGKKRIGLAHTDLEKIIASPLDTVLTKEIFNYLNIYFEQEDVDTVVVGYPKTLQNQPAQIFTQIQKFIQKIKVMYNKPIYLVDERFTSKIAKKSLLTSNMKKSKRQDKSVVDKISATLILQSFLDREKNL
tara:strand:+ start:982 stop:1398 length:417 start_codon:yes stop_codon:yes gene_type:complete